MHGKEMAVKRHIAQSLSRLWREIAQVEGYEDTRIVFSDSVDSDSVQDEKLQNKQA